MGMLDDAIREHLELKRLRGADPSEVAREQREALDPARADESDVPSADGKALAGLESHSSGDPEPGDPAIGWDEHPGRPRSLRGEDPPKVAEETAELDMQSVLDDETRRSTDEAGVPTDDPAPVDPAAAGPDGGASPELSVQASHAREEGSSDSPADTSEQEQLWSERRVH